VPLYSRAPLKQRSCDRTLSRCKTSTVFNDSDLVTFEHSGTNLPFYWRQCSCLVFFVADTHFDAGVSSVVGPTFAGVFAS
jgi:hypothetical protein